MKRTLGALVALVVALTTALAVEHGAEAATTSPRVTIVIAVDDCEGCTVQLFRGDEWGWKAKGLRGDTTVKDGKVTFTLPRQNTKGLVVGVIDPNGVFTNANAMAVMRYASQKAGQPMTKARAIRGRHAYFCAAAVSRTTVHWHLKVAHVAVKGGYDIRPFFSPGVRTYGTPRAIPKKMKGGFAVNGDFYCVDRSAQ